MLYAACVESSNTPFGIAIAIDIARTAHAGQVDKQGRDYFTHHLEPIAKLAEPLGEHAVMVAYLHDLIEDTDWTLDDLAQRGCPAEVVEAVDVVTRRPGETYTEFIQRVCDSGLLPNSSLLAIDVKLFDNEHNINCNAEFAAIDPVKAEQLLNQRYKPARVQLLAARARKVAQNLSA